MDIYDRIDAAEADIARLGQDWLNTYVVPYYLNWMSSNVLRDDITPAPLGWLPDIKQRARELDTATIRTMLNCAWRIQVMGAWYAIAKNDTSLADAVNDSLDICFGHLTRTTTRRRSSPTRQRQHHRRAPVLPRPPPQQRTIIRRHRYRRPSETRSPRTTRPTQPASSRQTRRNADSREVPRSRNQSLTHPSH